MTTSPRKKISTSARPSSPRGGAKRTAIKKGVTSQVAPKKRPVRAAQYPRGPSKKLVSILVVDDDLSRRKSHYEKFFAQLEAAQDEMFSIHLIWAETPREAVQRVIGREADLILLDMMLTGPGWFHQSDGIYKAIKAAHAPLVLLSEDFTSDSALNQIHKIFFDLRGTRILGFVPFSPWVREHAEKEVVTIPDTQLDVWTLAFHEALDAGRDHRWQPGVEDEITFLHLTDTHFGKTSPDYLNADAIAKGAAKSHLAADFLLWTGDISNTGTPAEFRLAEKFLADLKGAGILAGNAPISMVPGNHDLNWPLALSSRASIVRNEDKKDADWAWKLGQSPVNKELWKFGFRPYSDFFEKIVAAEEPQKLEIGYRWLDQWVHRGFAILELPIECHTVRSDNKHSDPEPFVTQEDFSRVSENAFKTIMASALRPEICIIMLVHGRDPNLEPDLAKRWLDLRERLHEAGHPTIVFAGHEHEAQITPQRRELTIVGVPHDPKSIDGSTLPGIHFITLRGLNTATPQCLVTKLERRQDEISRAVVWKAQSTSSWGISGSAGYAFNWIQRTEH